MEKDIKKPQIRFQGFTEEWEQHKLGDYCEMYNGDRSSKYPNASDMVDDGIPFINAGDLENGSVNLKTANNITREKYNQLGGAKLQIGDIVYCLRGTLGKNAFIDNFEEGTIASSLVAIRPKNIDGRYLYYILNSDIEYRQRIVHDEGAAQPNLSAKSVSEFEIPIPSIGEQKKISAYFTKFDHLIYFHQRKYDSLVKVKKSMLEKMFPRRGAKKPEIRFAGFTDDWEQRKLGEIMDEVTDYVAAGSFADLAKNVQYMSKPDYAQLVRTIDLKHNFSNGSFIYVNKNAFDFLWRVNLNNECIILPNIGANIGEVYYIDPNVLPYQNNVLGPNAIYLKPKSNTKFIYSLFQTKEFQCKLSIIIASSGQPKFNKTELKEIVFSVPSFEEQKQIGNFFKKFDNLISLHQRKLNLLKNIKKAMLEKMFV